MTPIVSIFIVYIKHSFCISVSHHTKMCYISEKSGASQKALMILVLVHVPAVEVEPWKSRFQDPRKSWLWVAAVVGVSFSGKLSIRKACLWCPGKKKPEQTIGKSAGFTPGLMTRRVCKRIAWPLAGSIAFPKHASLQIISRGIS